jgi:hypothetical protein
MHPILSKAKTLAKRHPKRAARVILAGALLILTIYVISWAVKARRAAERAQMRAARAMKGALSPDSYTDLSRTIKRRYTDG